MTPIVPLFPSNQWVWRLKTIILAHHPRSQLSERPDGIHRILDPHLKTVRVRRQKNHNTVHPRYILEVLQILLCQNNGMDLTDAFWKQIHICNQGLPSLQLKNWVLNKVGVGIVLPPGEKAWWCNQMKLARGFKQVLTTYFYVHFSLFIFSLFIEKTHSVFTSIIGYFGFAMKQIPAIVASGLYALWVCTDS